MADDHGGAARVTYQDLCIDVTDLEAVWRARLDEVAGARAAEPAPAAIEAAVDRAIEEVALIREPHRAIDWLSTFPQVVLTALGERP